MSKSSTLERLLSQPELQTVNNCNYSTVPLTNSSGSVRLNTIEYHLTHNPVSHTSPTFDVMDNSRDSFPFPISGQNGLYPITSSSSMLALCDWSALSSSTDSEPTITPSSSNTTACAVNQLSRGSNNSSSHAASLTNMNLTLTDILNSAYSIESDFNSNNGCFGIQNQHCQASPAVVNNNPKESLEWCVTDVQVKHVRFTWTIDNFSLCIGSPGETLHSDVFSSKPNDKTAWCLQVAPNGKSHETKNMIALHLINVRSEMLRVPVRFRCSLLSPATGQPICSSDTGKFHLIRPWMNVGFSKFFERELTKSSKITKSLDRVTFYAEVYYVDRVENQIGRTSTRFPAHKTTLHKQPEDSNLATDFETLLEKKSLSDITVKSRGNSFSAHKAILAAGSPVLLELLSSDTTELNMDEFEPEAVHQLLIFLYSRQRLKNIQQSAKDLFKAAIKYKVSDLIAYCEVELSYQINVLNCFEFLAFAHNLSSSFLKNHSLEFIIRHSSSVVNTRGFKIFAQNYPQLLSETFLALAARNSSVRRNHQSQDRCIGEFRPPTSSDKNDHPLMKKRKLFDQSNGISACSRPYKIPSLLSAVDEEATQ